MASADQMPAIPGFAECWGKSIVPCPYCDGFEVAGQHWGLVWSGPHSLHAVTLFHDWTDRLTLFADGHDIDDDARADLARRNMPVVEGKIVEIAPSTTGRSPPSTSIAVAQVAVDVLFAHPRNKPSASLHEVTGARNGADPLGYAQDRRPPRNQHRRASMRRAISPIPWPASRLPSHGAMAGIFAQQSMLV